MVPIEPGPNALVRAVAYVRMSTDVQNHSIQHQLDSISAYAALNSWSIVRTFVDEGRSGLSLSNRPGLQALLAAATDAACDFSVIVVYDISRWGRFQDVDESAYYEYLWRRAGVTVVYCAEQFADDGSPLYAIMKVIKRAMAAEYSRELSVKVWRAQCRFSLMGYKQGGMPGYGLRRVPIGADGHLDRFFACCSNGAALHWTATPAGSNRSVASGPARDQSNRLAPRQPRRAPGRENSAVCSHRC